MKPTTKAETAVSLLDRGRTAVPKVAHVLALGSFAAHYAAGLLRLFCCVIVLCLPGSAKALSFTEA